jgi:PAS domain S-box-containing protein
MASAHVLRTGSSFGFRRGLAIALVYLIPSIWGCSALSAAQANLRLPILTDVASVRMLTDSQAQQGYPVRLRGLITYYDPDLPVLYIQNVTGGIRVELGKQDPALKAGQWVEVQGISAIGSFLPVISKATVRDLKANGLPSIHKNSISNLDARRDDSQWMQFEGIVQNAYQEGFYTVLEVYEQKHKIQIRIRSFSQTSESNLIDAKIQVRGVLAVITDSAHLPIGLDLWVPKENKISVLDSPPANSNQLPFTAISALENSWKSGPPQHRIRIQGKVMPTQKENALLVQDKSGMIEARTLFTRPIAPGDEVDLIGFADLSATIPRIINASFLRIKASAMESKEEAGLPTLTTIRQIHLLSSKDAARGYPVRIKGVITYHNPQLSMTFIQDITDAIYLQSLDTSLSLNENREYEVEGFSAPGDFAPIITKPKFRALGWAHPPPAKELTLDQLATGQYDCQRVRVHGIVRMVRPVGNRWCLELFDEGKGMQVWLPNLSASADIYSLQDAKIAAEGICSIQIGAWGNISGFKLSVPSLNGIRVEERAPFDPFSAPLRSVRDFFRFSNKKEANHRIRIEGVLLYQQPGKALYIKDDTGSISIPTGHILSANPNDILTVSGYPVPGEFAPSMEFALIKRLNTGPPPQPRFLPDARALNNNLHGDLVRIRARLIDQSNNPDGYSYILQDLANSQTAFEAYLESSAYHTGPPAMRNGSELELMGIYLLRPGATQKYGFQLLLRTSEDIRILKSAPWWTTKYTYWAIIILLCLILSASALAAMLKMRVNQQTKIIKQRLEIEAALESKYRELFEESNDIIFACDGNGRLMSINPAGARILGYSIPELLDLADPIRLIEPASLPKIKEWIEKREKGIVCPSLECELLTKDGRHILIEVNGKILHAYGKRTGAHGIARDVTERKQAEEALRQSEERFRQSQKLEAIGKLAGGIAHDFNNILAAILGYAELSASEISPEHPISANLEQIIKAGKRARNVVQQILAFSRKLDQERKPIYLQTVIEEAMNLLRATLPTTLQIETIVDPKCSPVLADSTQIHQVILNLATNAAHAMRENGGLLKIELEPIWPEGSLINSVPELNPGKYVRLSMSDTGPGIDPQIQKQIFEPYFTTKSVGEGSGLGLAVVHGIVQSHRGAITVKSTPGEGACFQVYLPCCEEKPVVPTLQAPEVVRGQGRILLVDDEEAIVALGRRSLAKLGYKVTGETSSVRALELLTNDPRQFDLVVTDQTMPQLTGTLLAQEIWRIRPDLPIIISTGYSEQFSQDKAAINGFHTLLHKPYTAAELAKTIQQCLKKQKLEVRS